jgi:DnaB-like helicase N terminal domain/AAA domain
MYSVKQGSAPFSASPRGAHEEVPPLPNNLAAERSVLGAILVKNKTLKLAVEKLKPEDFSHDRHRRIYQQMLALGEKQQAIDLVTLTDQLDRSGELESSGGPAYIAELIDGLPHITNVEHYSRIVKEKALLRSVIHVTAAIQQQALDAEDDADLILDRAEIAFANIKADREMAVENYRAMFHSVADFENSSGLTFAIDGFLQTGTATMIAGLSGQSKTLIQLSMVRSLLTGNKLWDLFSVKEMAARVIYLIPESSIGPFKYRLQLFDLMKYVQSERLLIRTLSKGPTPLLSDPLILRAAQGADVFLDTAARFGEGDENSAGDNQRGLASDIFALLGSGARLVECAHHAPKSFATQTTMTLENVARGSGDLTAMLATAWGIRQLDQERNIVYLQNVKPRDFDPCRPFQIIGRPYIDTQGDFRMHKLPGESGFLQEELDLGHDRGGASQASRDERSRRIALVKEWLGQDQTLTRRNIVQNFRKQGITVSYDTAKNYISEARNGRV